MWGLRRAVAAPPRHLRTAAAAAARPPRCRPPLPILLQLCVGHGDHLCIWDAHQLRGRDGRCQLRQLLLLLFPGAKPLLLLAAAPPLLLLLLLRLLLLVVVACDGRPLTPVALHLSEQALVLDVPGLQGRGRRCCGAGALCLEFGRAALCPNCDALGQ